MRDSNLSCMGVVHWWQASQPCDFSASGNSQGSRTSGMNPAGYSHLENSASLVRGSCGVGTISGSRMSGIILARWSCLANSRAMFSWVCMFSPTGTEETSPTPGHDIEFMSPLRQEFTCLIASIQLFDLISNQMKSRGRRVIPSPGLPTAFRITGLPYRWQQHQYSSSSWGWSDHRRHSGHSWSWCQYQPLSPLCRNVFQARQGLMEYQHQQKVF